MLKTLELWTFTGQIVWCVNLLVFGSTHSKWKLLGRFLGVKLHGISACAAAGAATLDPQPAAPRGNFRYVNLCLSKTIGGKKKKRRGLEPATTQTSRPKATLRDSGGKYTLVCPVAGCRSTALVGVPG